MMENVITKNLTEKGSRWALLAACAPSKIASTDTNDGKCNNKEFNRKKVLDGLYLQHVHLML